MPKQKPEMVQHSTNTWTLLLVAIAGGIIAVSIQPFIMMLYSRTGLLTTPISYHESSSKVTFEQEILTTTIAPSTTIRVPDSTTTTTPKISSISVEYDPTIDEELITLKNEPTPIRVSDSTTIKPIITEKSRESTTVKPPTQVKKSEETSQTIKMKKKDQQPNIIDITGKNAEIPDEVKNFQSTKINMIKTKKLWIPIPNSNGGHRRVPPVSIRAGKEHNSSVKHWLFEEFLSHDECVNLIRAHKEHVTKMKQLDPIICFDSVQTLRKHLKDLKPSIEFHITPNDFTKGTTCINATFSSKLKRWGLKWSYSTAFYPGESKFSTVLSQRIEEATALQSSHGGKFQITSSENGIGYKAHHDCILNGLKHDRFATFLTYLNTVTKGGETEFTELEIKISPKEGRAVIWNNMNENGECEPASIHSANIVDNDEPKYVLQRWYYYENFYSLGKRPPEPSEPERQPGQARVSCDEYDMGSCRAYDEWNYDHLLKYRNVHHHLI